MVQPKTPPLSIRIPEPLLAAIDAMAERKGMKRHAAILWALAMGEAADRGITPESTQRLAETIAKFPPRSPPTTGVELMALRRNGLKPGVEIKRIPPGPAFWPSGAAVLPEHISDPGADSTTRLDPDIRGFTASGEAIMKPKSLARPKPGKAKR